MIDFHVTSDGLDILFKNQLILRHTKELPCFYLGRGYDMISAYRGNYHIEDHVISRVPLPRYEIDGNTVIFYLYDTKLSVTFTVVNQRLHLSFSTAEAINRLWIRLAAEPDEKIYGCGVQASYFNLRGRSYPLWTSEAGVGRDKKSLMTFYADLLDRAGGDYHTTYYPETTFVSTRKYWCHVHTTAYAQFDFRSPDCHELHMWDVPETMIIEFAEDYPTLIERLTDYTGRPPKLPEYLHEGIVLGLQGGTDTVRRILENTEKHGVAVSGLWCQDWVGHNYTSFGKRLYWNWIWNDQLYPGLDQFIAELREKGQRFMGYICPFLLKDETLFKTAEAHGYLALNQKGSTYIEDFGEFDCGIVDLTNPDAFEWYKSHIKTHLIDFGFSGWMADFGEYLPVDCVLHNGIDAKKMHNAWPVLWARCNYEALKERNKLGEVFYFMRAGGHGSQRYAVTMWAGDQSVIWEEHDGIASVTPIALSSGMTGIPYMHSDIGGYTSLHGNIRTQELFERWCEMSVFSAYMRTHEGNRPAENFQFYHSVDTLRFMARMTRLRQSLKPYIGHLVNEASERGLPLQRPLFMHYPDDPRCYTIQNAFLFGRDLLVHPVVKPNVSEQTVYLPKDRWVHVFSGTRYDGGEVTVSAPLGEPPVFYREDAPMHDVLARMKDIDIEDEER